MSGKLFLEIVIGISTYGSLPEHFEFFNVSSDATGQMSFSVIMKYTFAIRQLAYGTKPYAFHEYLQWGEPCVRDCLILFYYMHY